MEDRPIPPWTEASGWRDIPVEECGERLVAIPTDHPRLIVRSAYHAAGIPGAPSVPRARVGTLERLLLAAESLPARWALIVHDAHRPLAVQQILWDMCYAQAQRDDPTAGPEAWDRATSRFVARPLADSQAPPPHRSGGAVDVSLFDRETGNDADFGTPFDATTFDSATRHFENADGFSVPQRMRRLLFHTMVEQGFANYHAEWWHYDWGNQRWANLVGSPVARYGIPRDE